MDNSRYIEMTTRPVPGLILSLAAPTILSMLVTSFYNLGDTFFVSRISTQATVMAVMQAIGFMFGHGSGNFVSRKLGAQQTDVAARMLATGFVYGLLAGVAIAAFGLLFLKPLCVLLGSTPTILPYTEKYLGIVLLAIR